MLMKTNFYAETNFCKSYVLERVVRPFDSLNNQPGADFFRTLCFATNTIIFFIFHLLLNIEQRVIITNIHSTNETHVASMFIFLIVFILLKKINFYNTRFDIVAYNFMKE